MPALTTTPSIGAPDWRAFCTSRLPPTCSFHRYGSRNSELNWMARPGSSSVCDFLDALGEDLLGDLAAAGELGPVAGVGCGRDDLGVDGRRGHAGQQDR